MHESYIIIYIYTYIYNVCTYMAVQLGEILTDPWGRSLGKNAAGASNRRTLRVKESFCARWCGSSLYIVHKYVNRRIYIYIYIYLL